MEAEIAAVPAIGPDCPSHYAKKRMIELASELYTANPEMSEVEVYRLMQTVLFDVATTGSRTLKQMASR